MLARGPRTRIRGRVPSPVGPLPSIPPLPAWSWFTPPLRYVAPRLPRGPLWQATSTPALPSHGWRGSPSAEARSGR